MSPPAHAVILDVDGTLVDSNDAHARAWIDAFAEAGITVPYERVRRAIGMGGDKLMPHVAGLTEDSEPGSSISERRGEIFKERYLPQVRAFPGVRDLVRRLIDDGFTVVVASSAKEDELGPLLERAGVDDLIDHSTSSDDAERSKPDPDIVQAALARSKAAKEMAVMIGDTPYDVEAALRAGVAIVGVESGGWRRTDLPGALAVYTGVAEIRDRYDTSIFASLAAPARSRREGNRQFAERLAHVDWTRVLAGALLIAGAAILVRLATRRSHRTYTDEVPRPRPGLGPRDREELRQIIARIS